MTNVQVVVIEASGNVTQQLHPCWTKFLCDLGLGHGYYLILSLNAKNTKLIF